MIEKTITEKKAGLATSAAAAKKEKVPASKSKVAATSMPSSPAKKETSTKTNKSAGGNVTKPAKGTKPVKSVKQKMVRDSFTMPEGDYANLALLKARCLEKGVEVKKSELVRAGLNALSKMTHANLIKVVAEVERLKTGRPKSK